MFEINKYTPDSFNQWNEFISAAKNSVFLFNRNYMDYHQDRFNDHSLLISKSGKLVAVLPAHEKEKEIFSHAGLSFGGLVMSKSIRAEEVLEIFSAIKKYYGEQGFTDLQYKVVPHIFHDYPAEEDLYALFRNDAVLSRRDIASILPIKEPMRFSETKRQMVSKCQKAGVLVSESKNFAEYWQLLESVLTRFNAKPVHTIDEISLLHERFPKEIRLFEARLEGRLLAGLVIYDYNRVVHTQYMANSDEGRKLGALDFINHELINGEYASRDYYSFGTSNEEAGRVLNTGLILQKEMMGGRGIVYDVYKMNLNAKT